MKRIAHFPAVLIEDCKRSDYASIDLSIAEALKERAYWLYGTTSKTPAIKRDSLQRTRTAFSSTGRIRANLVETPCAERTVRGEGTMRSQKRLYQRSPTATKTRSPRNNRLDRRITTGEDASVPNLEAGGMLGNTSVGSRLSCVFFCRFSLF